MKRQVNAKAGLRWSAIALCWLTAHAHDAWAICVSNDAEFSFAATAALFAPTTIELVQGTYHIDDTLFDNTFATFQGFSLLGGFTANCAGRNISPDNTTLTTHAGSGGWFAVDVVGDVTIEGVHFSGPGLGADIGWSDHDHDIPDSVHLVVSRSVFSGGSNRFQVEWDVGGSQTLSARLIDSLVHDVGSDGNNQCAVELAAEEGSDATFDLINNTIVNNSVGDGGVCIARFGDNEGTLFGYNNILYGNTGFDFATHDSFFVLIDNVIGSHSYPAPLIAPVGTQTGDPKLNASFHPIVSPPSPAINSGINNVPGGLPTNDLDGGPRVVGSKVDRGAYESNVDDAFILPVTTANDSGSGSLRAAINSANSNGGFNIITFAIGTGCGPHVITLQAHLPNITANVLINGYTQPGSSPNNLDVGDNAVFCIVLDGGTNTIGNGFNVLSGAATFEGLAFSGFTNAAINLQGGSDHVIEGVRIGGSTSGGALDPVHDGIDVGLAVTGVTIGGSDNGKRNIIGDATFNGINIAGGSDVIAPAHNNQIVNNYIGVGWNNNTGNFTNLGNGQMGLRINGRTNTISDNVIGFNFLRGIDLYDSDAHNNTMSGNFIGVSPRGDNLGNSNGGVYITQDAHDNTISGNTIAHNQLAGIGIASGQHNLLRANSIHDNSGLGIDLGSDGVTPNDNDSTPPAGDPPNRDQNFPVLTGAIGGHNKGKVSGTLTSTPGDYRIEFFASAACDASGHGPGEIYLSHTSITLPNLTLNGQTTVSFSATLQSFFLQIPGEMITATATAQAAGVASDTSEFSACFPYTDDTIFANGFDPGLFGSF